jgi:hypothetical protein
MRLLRMCAALACGATRCVQAGRCTDLEELLDFIALSEVYGTETLVVCAVYQ